MMFEEPVFSCPFCRCDARVVLKQLRFLGWNTAGTRKKIRYGAYVTCNRCKARGPIVADNVVFGDGNERTIMGQIKEKAIKKWDAHFSIKSLI